MVNPKLSVNINKVATLRNARGGNNPDVLQIARNCQAWGAQGITVHPRPDERHIRYADVRELRHVVHTEFNIEGYPDEKFLQLVEEVKPEQVTLVPDPPHVLTSNAGWNTIAEQARLRDVCARLKSQGMRVSLFLDPDPGMVEGAANAGAQRVELYTEAYARQFAENREIAISPYIETARAALAAGLGVNAGHDLDLENLHYLRVHLPGLLEVSIGHALICDALQYGLQTTIQFYLARLQPDYVL
ncbi:MAG: pyridoxine 5'-phosphate synthase [Bacteroidetes bacterium]|nr:pyridoxine 5'-phosphate synthase [Bacteroidota bacterium]